MDLTITDAHLLVERAMRAHSYTADEASIIADHLIDCELRGLGYGGLARALSIIDRLAASVSPRPVSKLRETTFSATFDGGDQVGYLVADRVTATAIEKARAMGIAVVGAHETWYTGMFSYYLERITAAGFVGLVAGSGGHIVAPEGGTEGRYGTNPIAFGFPSDGAPVIWDIGTSSVTLAEVILKMRLGEELAPGLAFDGDGAPTTNAMAALAGRAFKVWGGHRGSGLAMVVQLLGMLCGAAAAPDGLRDCGFFMLVIDPAALTDAAAFRTSVSAYVASLRATRPEHPGIPVRVPFERSLTERARRLGEGSITVADEVVAQLTKAAEAAGAIQRQT